MTIKMFRLITGEDIIAEQINDNTEQNMDIKNAIVLMVIPSRTGNPNEQTMGFAPYPNYLPKDSDITLSINKDNIVFTLSEVDPQFLEQYNQIFAKIIAPSNKIILK